MDTRGNQTKRPKALRKRIRKVLRVPFVAKQFAWRLTASWFWIRILAFTFGFKGHLHKLEDAFFFYLNTSLISFGFAPSNPGTFIACVKLLWLFTISGFSWLQVIGFFLYVPFLPIVFLVRILLRSKLAPYRKMREESFKKSRKSGIPIPKRAWGFPLLCLLLLWFILYGQTSARYPLFLAMVLTALLFCSLVGSALTFALPADKGPWARIEGMSASARKFVIDSSENLKAGKVLDKWQLNLKIWTGFFLLRNLRLWSRWLHGKAARRRTALLVLLRFMANLAALGAISILFWAIATKFALAPAHVALSEALLASASHAIPGIPDPSTLKVPATIQTLDSLMAWLVFVLYAGPVASLFPAFQEQAIGRSIVHYSRLRSERTAIYQFLQRLLPLQTLVREHPEIIKVAKAAVSLRTHSEAETRQALLSQPETLRALVNAPTVADLMRQLGTPLPNLEELVQELPSPTVDERSPSEVKPQADQHTAQKDEEEAIGKALVPNGEESDQLQIATDQSKEYGP
jgi:hypothetical protein